MCRALHVSPVCLGCSPLCFRGSSITAESRQNLCYFLRSSNIHRPAKLLHVRKKEQKKQAKQLVKSLTRLLLVKLNKLNGHELNVPNNSLIHPWLPSIPSSMAMFGSKVLEKPKY